MRPLISVVIPLYNKAPHIYKTLNSVLAQKIQPQEIIVVDDGSNDGGDKIVERLNNPLIKLHRQTNKGVSSARNAGVNLAKGSHIAFLDADDEWESNHIQILLELIKQFPGLGAYSTIYKIQQADKIILPKSAYPVGTFHQVDDFFSKFAIGLSLIHSSTACIKRESLIALGGFPEGVQRGEDIIMWIKLARGFGMAHAATYSAIYNRDAVNRSIHLRKTEPPGSLLYLTELLSGNIDPIESRSGTNLFACIAFYTAAGMVESRDYGGVMGILNIVKLNKLWWLYAKIILLLPFPSCVMSYARYWRHRLL
jgi:glycosyltransferase involved in cell wall biosynthesis